MTVRVYPICYACGGGSDSLNLQVFGAPRGTTLFVTPFSPLSELMGVQLIVLVEAARSDATALGELSCRIDRDHDFIANPWLHSQVADPDSPLAILVGRYHDALLHVASSKELAL